jgi:hypothetical protein
MSFESVILSALRSSTAITALVPAAKIYFGKVPQGVAFPFMGCFRISTNPTLSTDNGASGAARLDNIKLQVTVYCETEPRAHAAADAIRGAIESLSPTKCFMTDQQTTFDDPTELQGQILQFSCWYPGSSPV